MIYGFGNGEMREEGEGDDEDPVLLRVERRRCSEGDNRKSTKDF